MRCSPSPKAALLRRHVELEPFFGKGLHGSVRDHRLNGWVEFRLEVFLALAQPDASVGCHDAARQEWPGHCDFLIARARNRIPQVDDVIEHGIDTASEEV